jgi:plasmid stabilization system protein ParE
VPRHYRILFSARAAADLASIHQYIEQDSPQNATSVAAELVDAIDGLELLPHRYAVYQGRGSPGREVRRMPVPPFLIYYRVDDAKGSVGVITIRHGKQRQPRRFA